MRQSLITLTQLNHYSIKSQELGETMKEAYYLWLLVLTLFIFLFLIKSREQPKKYRILTLLFQQIIIIGFFLFVLMTSNPFNYLFPIPNEGLGLNPILQDPALAIHPPILYLGYVGTSIIFSSSLAAVTQNYVSLKNGDSILKNGF